MYGTIINEKRWYEFKKSKEECRKVWRWKGRKKWCNYIIISEHKISTWNAFKARCICFQNWHPITGVPSFLRFSFCSENQTRAALPSSSAFYPPAPALSWRPLQGPQLPFTAFCLLLLLNTCMLMYVIMCVCTNTSQSAVRVHTVLGDSIRRCCIFPLLPLPSLSCHPINSLPSKFMTYSLLQTCTHTHLWEQINLKINKRRPKALSYRSPSHLKTFRMG